MNYVVYKEQMTAGEPLTKDVVEALRIVLENRDHPEAQNILRKLTKIRVVK